MNESNNIVFNIGLKLRLKALCFCFFRTHVSYLIWLFHPIFVVCFFCCSPWTFLEMDGLRSWNFDFFPRRIPYVGRFARRNLPVFFGYTPWHSQHKKRPSKIERWKIYLETKITCAKSIARWFKDIQFVTFLSLSWRSLDLFLGGSQKSPPQKGHHVTIAELPGDCFFIFHCCKVVSDIFLDNDMIHLSFIQFPSCRCALVPSSHNITPNILEDLGPP